MWTYLLALLYFQFVSVLMMLLFFGFLLLSWCTNITIFQISPSNILLFHLAVIETLLCIIFFILAVPLLTDTEELITTHTVCNLNAFLTTLLQPIALWTVCGLNCDRYYAISAPLHYNAIVNSKKVRQCVFVYIVWFLVVGNCAGNHNSWFVCVMEQSYGKYPMFDDTMHVDGVVLILQRDTVLVFNQKALAFSRWRIRVHHP